MAFFIFPHAFKVDISFNCARSMQDIYEASGFSEHALSFSKDVEFVATVQGDRNVLAAGLEVQLNRIFGAIKIPVNTKVVSATFPTDVQTVMRTFGQEMLTILHLQASNHLSESTDVRIEIHIRFRGVLNYAFAPFYIPSYRESFKKSFEVFLLNLVPDQKPKVSITLHFLWKAMLVCFLLWMPLFFFVHYLF